VEHTLWAPYGDFSTLVSTVTITNAGATPAGGVQWLEQWAAGAPVLLPAAVDEVGDSELVVAPREALDLLLLDLGGSAADFGDFMFYNRLSVDGSILFLHLLSCFECLLENY
jgi:hypothetical protein